MPQALKSGFAFALLVVAGACSSGVGERELVRVLDERAGHVHETDRRRLARELVRVEKRTGIDSMLLLCVIEQESTFRHKARGPRGAIGLMQIRPETGRDVAERHGIRWRGDEPLHDLSTNLRIGATYLAELYETFGSWELALAAYNQGPTRVRKLRASGKKPTSRYAARILKCNRALRGGDG